MQNLESLHEVLLNLKAYYQQIRENNQAAIAKLQRENSLIEVQIHHADALLLGHQVSFEKGLQLVVEKEPPLPPQTNKRVAPNKGKKRKNRGSSPPLSEQYQGMSVLAAAAEIIKSRCGEVLSVRDIFAIIFLPHHSKQAQADLRNLLSRELSRGVKEGRFYRVENIAGHYTWDLSKIKKIPA